MLFYRCITICVGTQISVNQSPIVSYSLLNLYFLGLSLVTFQLFVDIEVERRRDSAMFFEVFLNCFNMSKCLTKSTLKCDVAGNTKISIC